MYPLEVPCPGLDISHRISSEPSTRYQKHISGSAKRSPLGVLGRDIEVGTGNSLDTPKTWYRNPDRLWFGFETLTDVSEMLCEIRTV